MWRDALVVAGKDLRIEGRAKVALNQVVPYSLVVLLLFGFAFDQDRPLLVQAAPGLFWLAVLFSGLLAVQRSFAIETADGAVDGLRMSGLEPAGVFLGKAAAVALELIVLEALLAGGIVVLFHSKLSGAGLLAASALLSTAGRGRFRHRLWGAVDGPPGARDLAAAAAGARAGAGRTGCYRGLAGRPRPLGRRVVVGGWRWLGLLGCFAAIYLAGGVLSFGALMEET